MKGSRHLNTCKQHRTHHAVALLGLTLLGFTLLFRVTLGGDALVPGDVLLLMPPWKHHASDQFPNFRAPPHAPLLDPVQQHYPWRKFYAESLRGGELPLWCPYMFCGHPFVGNGQSALFYPPNLLFAIMDVKRAFGWCALIHLLIAGFGMYAFLSLFRLHPLSCFIGGAVFMTCGFFMAWLCYITFVCASCWLPWALFFFEKSTTRHSNAAANAPRPCGRSLPIAFQLLGAGAALGLSLLAGHFQVAFYVWLAFGLYALARTGQVWAENRFQRAPTGGLLSARLLIFALITVTIGLFLAGPQLLPSIELSRLSARANNFDLDRIWAGSLPSAQLVRLIIPNFFGSYADKVSVDDDKMYTHWQPEFEFGFVERTGYVGILPLLLAAVALAFNHRLRPFGLLLLVVGLLMLTGPLHAVLAFLLPPLRQMVGASRGLFLFGFSIALLAAVGADKLFNYAERKPERELRVFSLALGTALLLIITVVMYGWLNFRGHDFFQALVAYEQYQLFKFVLFLAASMGVCGLLLILKHPSSLVLLLAPVVILIDLLPFAANVNPAVERRMVYSSTDSLRWLQQNVGNQRILSVGSSGVTGWMPSNSAMVYGLADVQGSDSLWTMRWHKFMHALDPLAKPTPSTHAIRNLDSPLLHMAGARYVLSDSALDSYPNLKLVRHGDLWIYENISAQPRATISSEALHAESPEALVPKRSEALPNSFANIVSNQLNVVAVNVRVAHSGWLTLHDAYYPGWRAFVDGKESEVRISKYAFRGIPISQGDRSILFVFLPTSVTFGIFLALIICLLAGILLGIKIMSNSLWNSGESSS